MKMIPVPIPLWNISVWNAVIFEKIVSEDLPNRRGLFRLGLIEISPIWMCTKSLLKTEWFFTIFSWLGWRIELKLSQVCYFMYILNHLKYEHHLQLCCQLNQSCIIHLNVINDNFNKLKQSTDIFCFEVQANVIKRRPYYYVRVGNALCQLSYGSHSKTMIWNSFSNV